MSTNKNNTVSRSYAEVLKTGTLTLSKPFKFEEGPEVASILLPLSKMTGADIVAAQDNFELMGGQISGPVELNKKYQAHLAAYLANVKPEFILALPVADFSFITLCIQRFLLDSA